MPRRGRSASPPPAQRRSVPSHVPAHTAPAHPPAPVAAAAAQPQQPSMFKQMAATAGGVAIGSAVGHTLGHAMTGMMGGGGSSAEAAPAQAAAPQQAVANGMQPNEPVGPCAWEIKRFLQCAQDQADLSLCEGFNEAIRQCKQQHSLH